MNPALLIFDMDGVLVDSEPIANRIMHRHLAASGVPLDLAASTRAYIGRKMGFVVADIRARFDIALPADFERRCREDTLAAYESELRPVAGVRAAIESLPFARCLASSSDPARIARSLAIAKLDDLIPPDARFSSTMVAHGKPAPDLFLFAAARMGADPADCLVIEDTLVGLEAARAAGMAALAYAGAGHTPRDELAALAARAFDRMDELPGLVQSFISK
jgi:HAD superfamily hydrolase (TIGR01509 family)